MTQAANVTEMLAELEKGDKRVVDGLFDAVYVELNALAHQKLRLERQNHTLRTVDLVHETYLKMVDQTRASFKSRSHFMAVAAQAMRRILVNYAQKHHAAKRNQGQRPRSLDEDKTLVLSNQSDSFARELVALNDAMMQLKAFNERGYRVVECRFFGGMNYDEIAEVMGVSVMTIRRSWMAARAWLKRKMAGAGVEQDQLISEAPP